MQRTQKERVVTELAEQLRSTESLIVADYRGLTNAQLEELRAKLRAESPDRHGRDETRAVRMNRPTFFRIA